MKRREFIQASFAGGLSAALNTLFADEIGVAFTLADVKARLPSTSHLDPRAHIVLVNNRKYYAYAITDTTVNPETPADLFHYTTYLITETNGAVVMDADVSSQAAFAARFAHHNRSLQLQIQQDIETYTKTMESVHAAQAITDITKPVISILIGSTTHSPASVETAMTAAQYGLQKLADLTDALPATNQSTPQILSSLADQGRKKLEEAASSLTRVLSYEEAVKVAANLQAGYAGIQASLTGLVTYYQSPDFFILDEVLKPVVGGVDSFHITSTALNALTNNNKALYQYLVALGSFSETLSELYSFDAYSAARKSFLSDLLDMYIDRNYPELSQPLPEITHTPSFQQAPPTIYIPPQQFIPQRFLTPPFINPQGYWKAQEMLENLSSFPKARAWRNYFKNTYDSRIPRH